MDVLCQACGAAGEVPDEQVARHPVEFTCDACGARHVVTKRVCRLLPAGGRVSRFDDAPFDADEERLRDLAAIAERSDAGRASRVSLQELLDAPESVRRVIRVSQPPGVVERRRWTRTPAVAGGVAASAVLAAVALAYVATSPRADAVERHHESVDPVTPL
ncbi:MAG TPA: zinc-ribbon domain-containing protein, partial [Minicystis sp.]|nr:zinc-ribbon domain-containing protein [Minicystis sp.]